MAASIIFQIADQQDCTELAKLKLAIWQTTYQDIYPKEKFDKFNFEEQAKRFRDYILDNNGMFYLAKDKTTNKIVGYCYAGHSSKNFQKGTPEIILLYVLNEYQHQGIGREFFEKSKQFFKNNGHNSFIISCNKYNHPAQYFYEKMGGKIIHTDDDNVDKSLPQIKYFYDI